MLYGTKMQAGHFRRAARLLGEPDAPQRKFGPGCRADPYFKEPKPEICQFYRYLRVEPDELDGTDGKCANRNSIQLSVMLDEGCVHWKAKEEGK